MKRYLLDTSVLSAYVLRRPGAQQLVAPWVIQNEAATSTIVYAEIIEYFKQFTNFLQRRTELRQLLSSAIYPYGQTYEVSEYYADIRRAAAHGSMLPSDSDVLIAATALGHRLILVTIDSDFQRIAALFPTLNLMRVTPTSLR